MQDIEFHKISDNAINGEFFTAFPSIPYEERKKQLKEFSEYADDGVEIQYTYELNQRSEYEDLILDYNLDSLVEGYKDVELMKILLEWVTDSFRHDGSVILPKDRNVYALIDSCQQNNGINCRGLSIILAEVLRLYGIPATHITCMPMEAEFTDCHVVTHAYSEELDQWIMLDPTYKLILKDSNDDYINLPMLRNHLINNTKLKANDDAGWNGNKFYIDNYREYMTKNTFRFSCQTDLYYGSDAIRNNIDNMLIPLNYSVGTNERVTTSDTVFWATP